MKFVGLLYDNNGNKICEFNARTKIRLSGDVQPLVPENTIMFEYGHIQELDIMKITQVYKTICEMI